jgi:hypothetical protein
MLVDGFEVSWLSGPCQDLCGNPGDCSLRETTWTPKCSDHGDYCITTMGFHVDCGKMNNVALFFTFLLCCYSDLMHFCFLFEHDHHFSLSFLSSKV